MAEVKGTADRRLPGLLPLALEGEGRLFTPSALGLESELRSGNSSKSDVIP